MHIPYEEKIKHKADFRVRYSFRKPEEGGRKNPPFQGYRPDFWYYHKDNKETELFMICPEFEDETKKVILENNIPVPLSGIARMWVVVPARRKYHKERIQVGTKGYFLEGSSKVAECEVIEIIGLLENPTE